jgi:UDP-glucuronate 4-epimerase
MKVLLTGAAGFIGSHVTERLLDRGHAVVGVDSFDPFYPRETKERNLSPALGRDGFTFVEADIRDRDALSAVPEDFDAIIHLAALAGVRPSILRPADYMDVNVAGTVVLLELARDRGVRPFVFASSSSVYGERETGPFREDDRVDHPISPYAATKKAGELIAHTYHHLFGLDVICLRFFTVYGPRQRPDLAIHKFARLMVSGQPIPVYGDGTTERDYTYIDDAVSGVERSLAHVAEGRGGYDVVNIGESRTVSLREMIERLSAELRVDPVVDRRPLQPGDVSRTSADISHARRLIGYDPHVPFEEGMRHFVEWFRSEVPGPGDGS